MRILSKWRDLNPLKRRVLCKWQNNKRRNGAQAHHKKGQMFSVRHNYLYEYLQGFP